MCQLDESMHVARMQMQLWTVEGLHLSALVGGR